MNSMSASVKASRNSWLTCGGACKEYARTADSKVSIPELIAKASTNRPGHTLIVIRITSDFKMGARNKGVSQIKGSGPNIDEIKDQDKGVRNQYRRSVENGGERGASTPARYGFRKSYRGSVVDGLEDGTPIPARAGPPPRPATVPNRMAGLAGCSEAPPAPPWNRTPTVDPRPSSRADVPAIGQGAQCRSSPRRGDDGIRRTSRLEATPVPIVRTLNQVGTKRIPLDVATHREEVLVRLHRE